LRVVALVAVHQQTYRLVVVVLVDIENSLLKV
jgi:hypothetical protein